MSKLSSITRSILLLTLSLLCGCTFHSSATHWNGVIGRDGKPIFVKSTMNLGLNLAVVLPIMGSTSIDEMMDESTAAIAASGSNHVRVIETSNENYWYGFPPFTWILTPVITTVNVEYQPSEEEMREVAANDAKFTERVEQRKRMDHADVIPDRRR